MKAPKILLSEHNFLLTFHSKVEYFFLLILQRGKQTDSAKEENSLRSLLLSKMIVRTRIQQKKMELQEKNCTIICIMNFIFLCLKITPSKVNELYGKRKTFLIVLDAEKDPLFLDAFF